MSNLAMYKCLSYFKKKPEYNVFEKITLSTTLHQGFFPLTPLNIRKYTNKNDSLQDFTYQKWSI